jgi:hypothetical protein
MCEDSQCKCTDQRPDCDNNGVCVDLTKDDKHCGTCGNACDGGTCRGGKCMP